MGEVSLSIHHKLELDRGGQSSTLGESPEGHRFPCGLPSFVEVPEILAVIQVFGNWFHGLFLKLPITSRSERGFFPGPVPGMVEDGFLGPAGKETRGLSSIL